MVDFDKESQHAPVVEVTWVDAASAPGWGPSNRVQGDLGGLVRCVSVGYLANITKDAVSLFQSVQCDDPDEVADIVSIPKACVESIVFLKPDSEFDADDFPLDDDTVVEDHA